MHKSENLPLLFLIFFEDKKNKPDFFFVSWIIHQFWLPEWPSYFGIFCSHLPFMHWIIIFNPVLLRSVTANVNYLFVKYFAIQTDRLGSHV